MQYRWHQPVQSRVLGGRWLYTAVTEHALSFAVFDKYMTISGFQIEETIDRETSGDLEKLLLAVGN